ncbi:MAG: hypothetical protein H6828_05140 [Planctomycetes bacterium]|nr:hypothetical protein [Planctomycetota bacterium]
MYWKSTVFALGLAAGLALARAQDADAPDDPAARRHAQVEARLARNVDDLRRMQGAWILQDLRAVRLPEAGRDHAAYLLVQGEFMALELHMGYFDDEGKERESYLQSGIYRLNFNDEGKLLAKLLIGTLDLGVGQALPRQPGMTSVFELGLAGGALTMTSEESTRFTWARLGTGELTRRLYADLDWLRPPAPPDDAATREAAVPPERDGD